VEDSRAATDSPSAESCRVPLAAPRIGAFAVQIQYPFSIDELQADKGIPVSVPLVMPTNGELGNNEVVASAVSAVRFLACSGPWGNDTSDKPQETSSGADVRWTTHGPQSEFTVTAQWVERSSRWGTIVERMWIQTWFTDAARQDRAVFRFVTTAPQLRIALPHGTSSDDLVVLLDGSPVVPQIADDGMITVHMAQDSLATQHRLELRYRIAMVMRELRSFTLQRARIEGEPWIRHAYWHVVVPQDIHFVDGARGFAREFVWQWDGWVWRRRPLLTQGQLENWSGATEDETVPNKVNQYLFSSVGTVDQLHLWTANRSSIVLVASAVALVAGLLWIYAPWSRGGGFLLGTAVIWLALGVRFPDLAVLGAQAAVLGCGAALLAGWLRFMIARRSHQSGSVVRKSARVVNASVTPHRFVITRPDSGSTPSARPAGGPTSNVSSM
jgi:hypothetical protein